MKVAMVTPLAMSSAVADVMMSAAAHVGPDWDLEVWYPTDGTPQPCPVPSRAFWRADAGVIEELSAFDLVVYVIGDSPRHVEILELAQVLPGLVVLHDASVTNLIRYAAQRSDALPALVDHVRSSVGALEADEFELSLAEDEPLAWFDLCARVPLIDLAIANSLGVVVHSAWAAARADGLTFGEVSVAPLPVPRPALGFGASTSAPAARDVLAGVPSSAVALVSVGAVNPNRCIDRVIEAIAEDPQLRETVHVVVAGHISRTTERDLLLLASEWGIKERVHLLGTVSDGELERILARADMCAALRDPVLEGKSGSLLTQMRTGAAVVVYDHGHYAELPDAVACKVDPKAPVPELAAALRRLVVDADRRRAMGTAGAEYVGRLHTGEAYARALVAAGEAALGARPLLNLATDVAHRLQLLGIHEHPVVAAAAADTLFELYPL
jgi:glycosyltransferase involved in cell wall biosynthesis